MSEYIVYMDPIGEGVSNMCLTNEEIVRCRDCKYAIFGEHSRLCLLNRNKYGEFRPVDELSYCSWGVKQ